MKPEVLVFGTKNFIQSLDEIKDFFDFNPISFHKSQNNSSLLKLNSVLIDADVCVNLDLLNLIKNLNDKSILLIDSKNIDYTYNFSIKISRPFNLLDFNRQVVYLLSSTTFNQNSSIQINNYILDKNEKKLKKNKIFINITEREVQLIELLFSQKKSLSKKDILQKIWHYSKDADTHTVETHIYRLRKKIKENFFDDNFIINKDNGYSI